MPGRTDGIGRRCALLLASMWVTFAILRCSLWFSPNTDLDVLGYNVHHLYTGLLVLTLGGIPLALHRNDGWVGDASIVVFGTGLAMALDEWVYLIVTDGTNASYLLPVSFWGALVVLGLATALALLAAALARRRARRR